MGEIKKASLDRIKRKTKERRSAPDAIEASAPEETAASASEETAAPVPEETAAAPEDGQPGAGFQVSRISKRRRARNIVFDHETELTLDEICYRLKLRTGRRVSASQVIRSALKHFANLSEKTQIRSVSD